jgi:nucleoside-diphosphate-sugar epimerase
MDIKDFYQNKKVLVTGGAGFIGSHLVEKLIELGAQVTVLDNLSTGFLDNLAAVKDQINFIEGDIRSFKKCIAATHEQELIFHEAAFVSAAESVDKPYECYEINVHGTLNILNAMYANQVNRLLFASSAAVYGNTNQTCVEDMECDPESPYGSSKLAGEKYCQQYATKHKLKTLSLRYFNVWGNRQDPSGGYAAAIAKFKHQMQNNLPITIYGDGTQTRDFIHVSKIVEANLALAAIDDQYFNGQPINLATGLSSTLLEMIEVLKKDYPDYKQEVTFAPERQGDIKHSSGNNQKLINLI